MEYIRKIRFDENFVVNNFNVVMNKEYMDDLKKKFFLIGVNFFVRYKNIEKGERRGKRESIIYAADRCG